MDCKDFIENVFAICDKRKFFIAEENKRKYVLNNVSQQRICKIKIDKGIIQDMNKNKCDYAFLVCAQKQLILVELKGTNFLHAVQQIISTIDLFAAKIRGESISARIVLSKVDVPRLKNNPKFLKLKKIIKSRNGDFKYASRLLEDTI